MDLIAKLGGIIKNFDALRIDYVPKQLLFRENQYKRILIGIIPMLYGGKARNMLLYGKPGTGKTVTIMKAAQDAIKEGIEEWRIIYASAGGVEKQLRTLAWIYLDLLANLRPDLADPRIIRRGSSYVARILMREIRKRGKTVLVIIDDADLINDVNALMYLFTRNEYTSLALVANDPEFLSDRNVDPRLTSSPH